MLQYIATFDDRYSIPEQIQMVTEGSCAWVQLRVPGMDDGDIRELAREIVPLCQESKTILVIEDHIELARELSFHGVHLTGGDMSPADVREFLGPEAIIGVQSPDITALAALKTADIDYVTFPLMSVDRFAEKVATARSSGCHLPMVAEMKDGDPAEVIMATGCSGVALHRLLMDAADPVEETKRLIDSVTSL